MEKLKRLWEKMEGGLGEGKCQSIEGLITILEMGRSGES